MSVAFKDIVKRGVGFKIRHFSRYYFWIETPHSTVGFTQLGNVDGYRTLTELRRDLHSIIRECTTDGKSFFIARAMPIIHYNKPKKTHKYEDA